MVFLNGYNGSFATDFRNFHPVMFRTRSRYIHGGSGKLAQWLKLDLFSLLLLGMFVLPEILYSLNGTGKCQLRQYTYKALIRSMDLELDFLSPASNALGCLFYMFFPVLYLEFVFESWNIHSWYAVSSFSEKDRERSFVQITSSPVEAALTGVWASDPMKPKSLIWLYLPCSWFPGWVHR